MEGREELKLIKDALARIADGSFGSCLECGKEIQDGRIDAVPYTRYCIECAVSMES
jgi:DnaK suppressor protein